MQVPSLFQRYLLKRCPFFRTVKCVMFRRNIIILIRITVTLLFAYILENPSSEAQQTKSFYVLTNGERQKSLLEQGTAEYFMVEKAISMKSVLNLFTNIGYSFRKFYCNRELIPDCWRSYRDSTFVSIELSFDNQLAQPIQVRGSISTNKWLRYLFLVYINDLDDDITSKMLKFGDDTKVFRKIKSDADKQHLQDDLSTLTEWSEKWQMSIQDMGMKMHNIQWVVLY